MGEGPLVLQSFATTELQALSDLGFAVYGYQGAD